MNNHSLMAIDLAKNTFQACLLDEHFNITKNVKVSRTKLLQFVLTHQAKEVVMEACYSSNYWGRLFLQHGFEVKLIPAQHVKPFVRGNKNDKNDALAIAEASRRPNMKSVGVKTIEQQDMQSLHRIRERLLSSRLRLSNQARGLLSEYGVTFAQGHRAFCSTMAGLIDRDESLVGPIFRDELRNLLEEYNQYQERLAHINLQIKSIADQDETHKLLMSIPGIGPIISTAIVSTIGLGQQFKTANEFAVWLGLTPRQYASGDKSIHLGITKRGDRYLRKQLVHGARAAMRWCRKRDDKLSRWTNEIIARRGANKASVALAHKLSRIAWAVLRDQKPFRLEH
jgi:transposase